VEQFDWYGGRLENRWRCRRNWGWRDRRPVGRSRSWRNPHGVFRSDGLWGTRDNDASLTSWCIGCIERITRVDGAATDSKGFLLDRRKSTKEETADIGKGGGATGGDDSCGEVSIQVAEGVVDAMSATAAVSTVDEHRDVILRRASLLDVAPAKPGIRVEEHRAATATGASGVVTASIGGEVDGWLGRFSGHEESFYFLSLFARVCKIVKQKEIETTGEYPWFCAKSLESDERKREKERLKFVRRCKQRMGVLAKSERVCNLVRAIRLVGAERLGSDAGVRLDEWWEPILRAA
jgi:hypothetical protein